jgi:hypothetical protein
LLCRHDAGSRSRDRYERGRRWLVGAAVTTILGITLAVARGSPSIGRRHSIAFTLG